MSAKKESKPFDLSNLDTSKTAEMGAVLEVLHPTEGTPLGIRITLAGADSDIYRSTLRKSLDRKRGNRPGQAMAAPTSLSLGEWEESLVNLLATCTLAWEGVVVDGEALPCNLANARAVYTRFYWIREQVNAFVEDRANFLTK